MKEEPNKFIYNYTAPTEKERKTAARIRDGYLPGERTAGGTSLPTVAALTLGIVGTVVFGSGFAFILEWGRLGLGSALCVIGMFPVIAAYPVYLLLSNRRKRRKKSDLTKH